MDFGGAILHLLYVKLAADNKCVVRHSFHVLSAWSSATFGHMHEVHCGFTVSASCSHMQH